MKFWTTKQLAELRKHEGKTLDEMADAMQEARPGVSDRSVLWACNKYQIAFASRAKAWPEAHNEALRALAGKTGTQMQKAMKKLRPDITRNGVVSQAIRLGVPLSGLTHSPNGVGVPALAAASKRGPKVKSPLAPKIVPKVNKNGAPRHTDSPPPPDHGNPDKWRPLPGVKPVSLIDRGAMQCAWPVDTDAGVQMFCGARCPDGKLPYCAQHRRDRLSPAMPRYLRDAAKAAA